MVAFRFSNLLRRLLGEGALQAAFIPLFEKFKKNDPAQAAKFFHNLFFLIAAVLICLVLIVEGFLFIIPWPPDQVEVIRLTAWMFPGILFICLYGVSTALLQCEDAFFISGAAPALFNLVWIGALFFLQDLPVAQAMTSLCQVVVFAYFAQWLVTVPRMIALTKGVWFCKPDLFSSDIKALLRVMGFSVISVGAVQLNAFFDALFARAASLEGPAWLWYAIRLEQLPMALFGIAISQALLPRLSRAIKGGEEQKAARLFTLAKNWLEAFLVPSTFVIFALGFSVVGLVYGRGEFSMEDQIQTSRCLYAYAFSLVPSAFCVIFSSLYWAKDDYKTPMMMSLLSVGVNIFLNSVFVYVLGLGAVSVAIATSASAWLNALLLSREAGKFSWSVLLASALAALAAWSLGGASIFSGAALFALVLWLCAHLFRSTPLLELFDQIGLNFT